MVDGSIKLGLQHLCKDLVAQNQKDEIIEGNRSYTGKRIDRI
jgi:hypothetical protein